jgi:hypothetical protein
MTETLKSYLDHALNRLSKMIEKENQNGHQEASQQIQRMRTLADLIKEQTPNEDTGSSTRQTR